MYVGRTSSARDVGVEHGLRTVALRSRPDSQNDVLTNIDLGRDRSSPGGGGMSGGRHHRRQLWLWAFLEGQKVRRDMHL